MLVVLALVCVLGALLYLFGTSTFDYWAKRGVKHDSPTPFIGNMRCVFRREKCLNDFFAAVYREYPNERFVGIYSARKPVLLLRDPELIKRVTTTDFNYFYSRGITEYKKLYEPLLKNLFFADGDLWKLLRQKMTPAFTSGKLKAMFPLIVEKAQRMDELIQGQVDTGADVDVKEVMARYTTDFIGAVGFGIDSDSMEDENSQFRKVGKRIFTITKWEGIRNAMKLMFPGIFRRQFIFPSMVHESITDLVRAILKQRNYQPSGRNDFVDQLIELKNKGKISVESVEHRNPDGTPKLVDIELDDYLMAAQVFIFFAAGFETSSSSSSYTLLKLAYHPEAQRKCQQEIDEVLSRYDGKLCYDAVNEMKYLDMCFREGMRLFPSLGFLKRRCEQQYHVPGTDFTIDPGVEVIISVIGLQRDPKYFERPEEFIPERFENSKATKYVYMPFGEGPRACIGERLGRMQSLAGLAAMLRRYTVAPAAGTVPEPPRDPSTAVVQSVLGGLPLRLSRRT